MCSIDNNYNTVVATTYDSLPLYANRKDIQFYVDLCREVNGNVLELGCGTGRILVPVAMTGINIVGLDSSSHMLEQCRHHLNSQSEDTRTRIELVHSNMTNFELNRKFDLIIIPFRPFQHLISIQEQVDCLKSVSKHLNENGLLVFDLFQVNFYMLCNPQSSEETEDVPMCALPDGKKLRRCSRIAQSHRAEQYNNVELIYYISDHNGLQERHVQSFPLRYFFRYEVEHLLSRTGFSIVQLFGNFDKSPLCDDSPEMIFVASKQTTYV